MNRKGSILVRLNIRVNNDPEFGQIAAEYDPELGQSDLIICLVCKKLTKYWINFLLGIGSDTMDSFLGHVDLGFFRV